MKKILSVLVMLMVIISVVFARRMDNPSTDIGTAVVKVGTTYKLYYKGTEQMDVKVSILDADDKLIFTEVLKKTEGFVRPYNFSNLPEGDYSIEIADKNGRRVESVNYQNGKVEKLAHLLKVSGSEGKYLLTLSNKETDDITVKIYDDSDKMIYNHTEEIKGDFAKIYNLERISGKVSFEITYGKGITTSLSY